MNKYDVRNHHEGSKLPVHQASSERNKVRVGQTFRTTAGGELESITIHIPSLKQGGTTKIDLYKCDTPAAGGKTLTYLGSSAYVGHFHAVENTFYCPVQLDANSEYAFVVNSPNMIDVNTSQGNLYTEGNAFNILDNPSEEDVTYDEALALPDIDLWFDVKVSTEVPTPENTTENTSLAMNQAATTPVERRQRIGQTFTSNKEGQLTSISVKVPSLLQGGSLKIDLYEFDSRTSSLNYIASSNNATYKLHDENVRSFDPPIDVNEMTNYAFVVNSGTIFNLSASDAKPYHFGGAFVVRSGASLDPVLASYSPLADTDLWFKAQID
ncbi:MAG: hypothetical protein JJ975_00755 [Bacteroidia bacterium]|nr:hypothetical protein [Bacteroidia bacterium]